MGKIDTTHLIFESGILEGATVTHLHPISGGYAFSRGDIESFVSLGNRGVRKFRAISNAYIFEMQWTETSVAKLKGLTSVKNQIQTVIYRVVHAFYLEKFPDLESTSIDLSHPYWKGEYRTERGGKSFTLDVPGELVSLPEQVLEHKRAKRVDLKFTFTVEPRSNIE